MREHRRGSFTPAAVLKSPRLAHSQDDGFHEIQLNGKQLVFLFMLATVVSVVIFLCGVLVGRGVRAERSVAAAEAGVNVPATEPAPAAAAAPAPAPAGSDPTAAAPPPAVDDLTYFNRLEKQKPAPEQLKTSAPKTTAAAKSAPAEARRAEPAPPSAGQNWTVQIAALTVRGEAEAIATRMTSKGYPAYVVSPPDGTSVYRVRVGKFPTRREAETLRSRLEKEEQLKPFVTR